MIEVKLLILLTFERDRQEPHICICPFRLLVLLIKHHKHLDNEQIMVGGIPNHKITANRLQSDNYKPSTTIEPLKVSIIIFWNL